MITSDQIKEIQERVEALYRYLDIESRLVQLEEEELKTHAPDFWNDQQRAEEQMKKVKGIKFWINGYNSVKGAAEELVIAADFFKEEAITEKELNEAYTHAITLIEDLECATCYVVKRISWGL